MKYRVRHLTQYRYSEPVTLSHHAAHLRPRRVANQSHREASLDIRPPPAVLSEARDYFANPATFFTIQDPHTELEIEAAFLVETQPPAPLPAFDPPWEEVRDLLAAGTDPSCAEAMDFLFPSPQLPAIPEAEEYARAVFAPGRPVVAAALDLTARIHRDFVFDPVATAVGTPLAQVFAQRRGVCQDFAHVGIACLRSVGLAARYVSGYIRTLAPPGKEKLVGADASHAWLALFVPGWGWMDLDPTNNCRAGEDHVVVAWGRDYDDVSPLKGVVLGGGDHQIHVSVDVFDAEPGAI